jgi:5'-deoxynucleotidase YfbR-like HD superfamily hydrolase
VVVNWSDIADKRLGHVLKTTKREGWRRFGINGESISDHMYRMSIMTMMAIDAKAAPALTLGGLKTLDQVEEGNG